MSSHDRPGFCVLRRRSFSAFIVGALTLAAASAYAGEYDSFRQRGDEYTWTSRGLPTKEAPGQWVGTPDGAEGSFAFTAAVSGASVAVAAKRFASTGALLGAASRCLGNPGCFVGSAVVSALVAWLGTRQGTVVDLRADGSIYKRNTDVYCPGGSCYEFAWDWGPQAHQWTPSMSTVCQAFAAAMNWNAAVPAAEKPYTVEYYAPPASPGAGVKCYLVASNGKKVNNFSKVRAASSPPPAWVPGTFEDVASNVQGAPPSGLPVELVKGGEPPDTVGAGVTTTPQNLPGSTTNTTYNIDSRIISETHNTTVNVNNESSSVVVLPGAPYPVTLPNGSTVNVDTKVTKTTTANADGTVTKTETRATVPSQAVVADHKSVSIMPGPETATARLTGSQTVTVTNLETGQQNTTTTRQTDSPATAPPSSEPAPTDCDKRPTSAGCVDLGQPAAADQLQRRTVNGGFADVPFAAPAQCPAPRAVVLLGRQYAFSFQPLCDNLAAVRGLILAMASAIAAFIFVDGLKT